MDSRELIPAAHRNAPSIFQRTPGLPKWMFWLAIITAYVTPFYMMRCWWLTFMGKPRDHHVHDHAHESPLMFIPLGVLAIGTFGSSFFVFRPQIADAARAATAAPLVLATDGHVHTPAIESAHHWLMYGVGGAFVVGFVAAIAVYGRGLSAASMIRKAAGPLYTLLEKKYYFDEVYDFIWVKGCVAVARLARFVDTYVVDLIFDTIAGVTERFAAFSGMVLDQHGVDGMVNGIAKSSMDFGNLVRQPQTGRIRNYVLFATAVAAVALVTLVWWSRTGGASLVTIGLVPGQG